MFRGAIIGFGEVAQKAHSPAFLRKKNKFRIIAVSDEKRERLEKAAEFFPNASLYLSATKLFEMEKNLDFVDIATPPSFHYELVTKSLKKNISVLCEKPLVLKERHLQRIKKISAGKKLLVFTVHNWKYSPQMKAILKIIKSGTLGKIKHSSFYTLRSKPSISAGKAWRKNARISGGGILIDHGWHIFYLLTSMAGEFPEAIFATLGFDNAQRAEEEANCVISFPSSTALAHMSWKSPLRKNFAVVYGSKGYLTMRDDSIILKMENGKQKNLKFKKPISKGSAHPEWMASLLDDFFNELKKPGNENLKEAECCLNLINSAKKSHFKKILAGFNKFGG